jgi:5-formyltetrahydrofolate cyclo-ligase
MADDEIVRAKQWIRNRVWTAMARADAVEPGPGVHGHIPAFRGASAAADRLAALPVWQGVNVVKAVPDRAQHPVRSRALADGKLLYMAVPRLEAERPFYLLDPAALPYPPDRAAMSDVAAQFADTVDTGHMRPIDLLVCCSVAVNREGARLGKGAGYTDIEFALLQEAGLISDSTTIVTTVHGKQVLDEPLPETDHDFAVDLIVTPEETIECRRRPRPSGLRWNRIGQDRIDAIPSLAARAPQRMEQAG